jgi:hypothetical protein
VSAEDYQLALEQVEGSLAEFLREQENWSAGRKGMQVPYHGFMAAGVGKLPPSAISDLRYMHRFLCLTLGKPAT